MHSFQKFVPRLAVISAIALASPSFAEAIGKPSVSPTVEDLRSYLLCEELAKSQVLSSNTAQSCNRAYQRVKLAFVPNIDVDRYLGLDSEIRAEINACGFDHFQDWKATNAEFLGALREEVVAEHFGVQSKSTGPTPDIAAFAN